MWFGRPEKQGEDGVLFKAKDEITWTSSTFLDSPARDAWDQKVSRASARGFSVAKIFLV